MKASFLLFLLYAYYLSFFIILWYIFSHQEYLQHVMSSLFHTYASYLRSMPPPQPLPQKENTRTCTPIEEKTIFWTLAFLTIQPNFSCLSYASGEMHLYSWKCNNSSFRNTNDSKLES